MRDDIAEILVDETRIRTRIGDMAADITRDFAGKELTVVGVLSGSCIFLADLMRRIPLSLEVGFLTASSYHGTTRSSGRVGLRIESLPPVRGRHVLLVDDILDTGRTLSAVTDALLGPCAAAQVRCCVLLRKNVARAAPVAPHYCGFDIPDEFVVGYGLDFRGRYRNLPFIGILTPEAVSRKPLA